MNLEHLLTLSIEASIAAGHEILDVYGTEFSVDIKSDSSPLTQADRKAHTKIMEYLRDTDYPVLSEEGDVADFSKRKDWHTFWLVDPLDGTKEFVKRNGEFTVNIALIENGTPIMGVIYVPVTDTLYAAAKGIGAYKAENGHAIHSITALQKNGSAIPHPPEEGAKFTVVGSRSHMSAETETFMSELEKEHGEIDVLSRGSSLKLCMVAEGSAQVYPRFAPTMEWDTGAGQAIAAISGCEVVRHDTGAPLTYNKENLLNPWFIVRRK